MQSFTARLKEPSTWAGVAVLGMMFGVNPVAVQAIGTVAGALLPFIHTDGGALAQAIIGLATLGGAGAAVALPETKPQPVVLTNPAAVPAAPTTPSA